MTLPLLLPYQLDIPNDKLEYWAKPWDGKSALEPAFYKWCSVRYRRRLIATEHLEKDRLTIPEAFVCPQGDGIFLVYSPLAGVMIQTNRDGLTFIRSLQDAFPHPSLREAFPEQYSQTVLLLQDIGLLRSQIHVSDLPMVPFRSLHLFLTSDCNFRCVYCFADAGTRPRIMPWEIAKAGIDHMVREAQAYSDSEFSITFQGNGEPLVAWPLLSRCVTYARSLAEDSLLRCDIRCATNGYINARIADWAIKHIDHLYFSWDGLPDIQDAQRPTATGNSSSARVVKVIAQADRAGASYSLRTTITAKSVDHLSDIVAYVLHHFPNTKFLHIEPLGPCARSSKTGWKPPKPETFVTNYIQALDIAKQGGIRLHYSGYAFDALALRHCDMDNVGLAITPEGLITVCQEVSTTDDRRAKHFIYGHYDPYNKDFEFNWDVYDHLMHRTIETMTYCQSCIVRWHCGGECPAKIAFWGSIDDPSVSIRCIINRLLFRYELFRYFEEHAVPLLPDKSNLGQQAVLTSTHDKSSEPILTVPDVGFSFLPTEVILLPTANCNLRCRYCYVTEESNDSTMPWQIARAAIDLIIANAKKTGAKEVRLGFHGGEPFMEWGLMQQSLDYGRQRAAETGLGLWAIAYTNGYLNNNQRRWAVENLNQIVVSLDGPPQIHNLLRPTSDGSGSFERVFESCKYFELAGMQYHIRVTVTAETISHLPQIISFFSELLACKRYSVEPLFVAGRCFNEPGLQSPSPYDFANYFIQARAIAKERGVSLLYSGIDMEHRDGRFCGAAGEYFIVNWNGDVYSCYAAASSDDPRCEPFRYGFFSQETGQFLFDRNKLIRLRNRVWWNIPGCRECNIAPRCAGDCLVKAALEQDMNEPCGTLRCQINRLLVKNC